MAIIKRNNKFRVQLRPKNQASISKTFNTHKEAALFEMQMKMALNMIEPDLKLEYSLNTIVDLYLDLNKNYFSVDIKKAKLNSFLKEYGNFSIKKITEQFSFEEYINAQKNLNLKNSTINTNIRALNSVFNFCIKKGWIYQNPLKTIKKLPEPIGRVRRISNAEQETLLRKLNYFSTIKSKEDWDIKIETAHIFLLAIYTGMRLSEICTIKKENLFLDEQFLFLPKTKNGDSRKVPLSDKAINLIKKIQNLNLHSSNLFLFDRRRISQYFHKTKKKLKISNLHFHDTRHEAISTFVEMNIPTLSIAAIVGIKDIKVLSIYYNPTIENLAALLNGKQAKITH